MKTKKEINALYLNFMKTKKELKATFDYLLDTHAARSFIRIKNPDPEIAIEYLVLAIAEVEKLKLHLEAWDQHRPAAKAIAQAARIRAFAARKEATYAAVAAFNHEPNPDNNPDKVSGFEGARIMKLFAATITGSNGKKVPEMPAEGTR